FGSRSPACSSPDLLRGIAWRHLTEEKFACPSLIHLNSSWNESIPTSSSQITAVASDTCVPLCIASGSPKPVIRWFNKETQISENVVETRRIIRGNASAYESLMVGDDVDVVTSCIRFHNFTESDVGEYRCIAENIAGRLVNVS